MCTNLDLAVPAFTKTFIMECYAWRRGRGVVLIQEWHLMAFINK